jgi:Domain of unknown function (DUF1931)
LHQQENQENLTAVNGSSAHSRHHRAEESEAMIAAAESSKKNTSHVMSVAKFERFFRIAAGLDVDKQDLKRYSDFINQKIYDLLVRAEATAKANGRAIIEPVDLPITKGLEECIQEFENIDEQIELRPILDQLTPRPPLGLVYEEDIEDYLPVVAGGLSVALARAQPVLAGAIHRRPERKDRVPARRRGPVRSDGPHHRTPAQRLKLSSRPLVPTPQRVTRDPLSPGKSSN